MLLSLIDPTFAEHAKMESVRFVNESLESPTRTEF